MAKKDLTILICDTSKIFCLGLTELLKKEKHVKHLVSCHTIIEALRLTETMHFDAAVIEDNLATSNKYNLISSIQHYQANPRNGYYYYQQRLRGKTN